MPVIDLELIAKTMRKYFSIQLKPTEMPTYKKPYLEWVDYMMPLSKGYKTLDFSSFFFLGGGEDGKSTIEHIGRFTIQSSEVS